MVTETHVRDMIGNLLWVEPHSGHIYSPEESFGLDGSNYVVERVALVDHVQHINVSVMGWTRESPGPVVSRVGSTRSPCGCPR